VVAPGSIPRKRNGWTDGLDPESWDLLAELVAISGILDLSFGTLSRLRFDQSFIGGHE
jgi:hypothetical protein